MGTKIEQTGLSEHDYFRCKRAMKKALGNKDPVWGKNKAKQGKKEIETLKTSFQNCETAMNFPHTL